jgi:SAM-dependent methyltransferase
MTQPLVSDENLDQAKYWNGPSGNKWVVGQAVIDAALEPLGQLGLAAADPKPGETVIDIGCGCGATSLSLGAKVGESGRVLGLDISAPMLAMARERAAVLPQIGFECADVGIFDLSGVAADLVFSRFGVMFFRDPVKAFKNIRQGLKPDGRMVFVCWRPLIENLWMHVPLQSALTVMPAPAPSPPNEPGPYAFADSGRVKSILTDAGFADIGFDKGDLKLSLGPAGNHDQDFERAVDFAMTFGPLGRALAELDAAMIAQVRQAITKGLEPHRSAEGVKLPAAIWIASARNPKLPHAP